MATCGFYSLKNQQMISWANSSPRYDAYSNTDLETLHYAWQVVFVTDHRLCLHFVVWTMDS